MPRTQEYVCHRNDPCLTKLILLCMTIDMSATKMRCGPDKAMSDLLPTVACNLHYSAGICPSFQQRREPWDLDELEKDDEDLV